MKHIVWTAVLVMMVVATGVSAREAAKGDEDAPTVDQLERHERALELQAREAELVHAQKLREMELQQREAEMERERHGRGKSHGKHRGGLLVLILLIHILLTVWVFKDMHEQKIGRALWVPIVLLTGIFGALLYAIVRNADLRANPPQAPPE